MEVMRTRHLRCVFLGGVFVGRTSQMCWRMKGVVYDLVVALVCGILLHAEAGIPNVGVNYGDHADNLPPPAEVVKLLKGASIDRIKLFDADEAILRALAKSGIEAVVGVTNEDIPRLSNPNQARAWVADNVVKYMPGTKFRYICVGNEVLTSGGQQASSLLLPAMQSLHNALVSYRIEDQVKVSTPHSLAVLSASSFPPSSGSFKPEFAESLKPILTFLSQTKSPLMLNAFPYFAFRSAPNDVPLAYALFMANTGFADGRTGLVYSNLLSAQLDAVTFALEKLNFRDLQLVVSQTGWPSMGDAGEQAATVEHAMTYNRNLVSYVSSGSGTPARPRQPVETYIFSMFNEDLKPGPTSERNFGIFKTDGSLAYDIGLVKTQASSEGNGSSTVPSDGGSSSNSSSSGNNRPGPGGDLPGNPTANLPNNVPPPVWCVAKPNADQNSLLAALNYACGEGQADCSYIQFGGPCFYPNDVASHASWAFNSYYIRQGGNRWNCYFGNTAILTLSDPSYGVCVYPSK